MKSCVVLSVAALCLFSVQTVSAQSFEDYRNKVSKAFDRYRDNSNKSFEEFRESVNKAFADYLRNAWKLVSGEDPIPVPDENAPDIPPVIVPEDDIPETPDGDELSLIEIIPIAIDEEPVPIVPIMPIDVPKEKVINFEYYGTVCNIRFNTEKKYSLRDASEGAAADMWGVMSESGYTNIVADCIETKRRLQLCDWGYYQVVDKAAQAVYGCTNEKVMLEAYVLCQSGYKLRLARDNEDRLHVLLSLNDDLYGYSYFDLDGERFYLADHSDVDELYITDQVFPSEKSLRMNIPAPQIFAEKKSAPRTLCSKRYPDVRISPAVNENLMRFYSDYPSSFRRGDEYSHWSFYANTPLSETVRESIYPSLKSDISGKNQIDAANELINFVQTAFDYKTDDDYWGYERAFFPEETLYYPISDCEDRAILFSRLIRDLMGLKVVLVYYPGHLATAVEFTDGTAAGDYLIINNHRYIISDPTYIGAPVGNTMPGMDNSKAVAIMLE